MTPEEFLATQFASLSAWIRSTAAAGESSCVHERDGVVAQVSPAVRDASLFNSVTYRDANALAAAMPELESLYEQAGVRAWTVWVHESDVMAATLLRAAGHVRDASPEGMGCELDDLVPPKGLGELDYTSAPAAEDLQVVLAEGYGLPLLVSERVSTVVPSGPDTIVGVANADGRAACTVQVTVAGQDAGVYSVATIPQARGRGLARCLQYALLQRTREMGARTTTLQASNLGRPVYAALGYQSFGPMNMWERRKPADAPA